MSVEIIVPAAGESVSSGVLATWLKGDGEEVSAGDELFELETDKATLAVPSPASGTLKQKAREGDEVVVGSVVGEIVSDGAKPKSAEATAEATASKEPPSASSNGASSDGELSPAVRRIVEENKLDPTTISGTGKGGRITKEDALKSAEAKPTGRPTEAGTPESIAPTGQLSPSGPSATKPAPPSTKVTSRPTGERQERVGMSTIRKKIAEHLVRESSRQHTLPPSTKSTCRTSWHFAAATARPSNPSTGSGWDSCRFS